MKFLFTANVCHNNKDIKLGQIVELNQDEIKWLIQSGVAVPQTEKLDEEKPIEKKGKKQ